MSTPLWTSAAMTDAMRAATQGRLPSGVTGLSIDSRTLRPGEAYFAIKGDVHDGHSFVEAALKAGARNAACFVEKVRFTGGVPSRQINLKSGVRGGAAGR